MAAGNRQAALQRSARLPFAKTTTTRDFTSTDLGNIDETYFDQYFGNCYLDTANKETKQGDTPEFVLKKRPGWTTEHTPAANTEVCTALYYWKGNSSNPVISAFGATTSTIYKNTTSVSTLTASRKVLHISEGITGTTRYVIFTTNTDDLYIYDDTTLTEITDADMPGNAGSALRGPAVALDGYLFVMTEAGRIYNSDLDSWTSWNALNFISTNMYPDFNVGLARYKNQLVAFGRDSIEFYTNVGNPVASPLQRNLTIAIKVGCVSQYAYASTEDSLIWIGSPPGGRRGLYYLDGYTAARVEDPKLDWVLKHSDLSTLRLQSFNMDGYEWAVISSSTFPTFCYNMNMKTWFFMRSSGGVDCWKLIATDPRGTIYGANDASNATTNGKIFTLSNSTFQDASTNYPVMYISPIQDLGTENQKRMYKLRLVGDVQTSATSTTVKWSDDDYRNWTSGRAVDMGEDRAVLYQLGSFRRRAFRLEYTGSNPWRLHHLEADFSFGVH